MEDRKEGKEGHEEGVRRHGMQESFSRVHIYKQHAHGEPEAAAKKKIRAALAYALRMIFKTRCLKYFAHGALNITRKAETQAATYFTRIRRNRGKKGKDTHSIEPHPSGTVNCRLYHPGIIRIKK